MYTTHVKIIRYLALYLMKFQVYNVYFSILINNKKNSFLIALYKILYFLLYYIIVLYVFTLKSIS